MIIESYIDHKNSPLGPKKSKILPNLVKSKVKIEEKVENRRCSTTWVNPKRKKWPLNQVKIKNQIEGNIRNKNQSTTRVDLKVDLKNVFQHNPNPMKANFCP